MPQEELETDELKHLSTVRFARTLCAAVEKRFECGALHEIKNSRTRCKQYTPCVGARRPVIPTCKRYRKALLLSQQDVARQHILVGTAQ